LTSLDDMQNLRLIALLLLSLVLGSPLHQASGSGSNRSGGAAALSREEALMLAFPKCKIEKQTVYLTKSQKAMASKLAKAKVNRNIVYVYEARRDGKLVGSAYFDAHVVRTKKEIVMFVLDLKDRIDRIELLSFAEPPEYIPKGKWYDQFLGKKLDDELSLKRGIAGVSGATLTARATTNAARRVLALHEVVKKSE